MDNRYRRRFCRKLNRIMVREEETGTEYARLTRLAPTLRSEKVLAALQVLNLIQTYVLKGLGAELCDFRYPSYYDHCRPVEMWGHHKPTRHCRYRSRRRRQRRRRPCGCSCRRCR